MPAAARINDPTIHGAPLFPGPGCLEVMIGYTPAWRALPSGMASAVEGISGAMDSFLQKPQMTPADAAPSLARIVTKLLEGGAAAAAHGAPEATGVAASSVATMISANVAFTATWTTAFAVPGGQAAATSAYTEAIKATAAASASAVVSAMSGLSDMHLCPLPVPPSPHGPGFVTRGSRTVLIGNLPAARQGDKVFEACGGEDPIAMGCPSVLIGDDGSGGGGAGSGSGGSGSGRAGGSGAGGTAAAGAGEDTEPSNGPFATADDAARAALERANPDSIRDNREYGGLIYRGADGQYYYTGPLRGSDQGVTPSDAAAPPGTTVVGDYHTHGDYSTVDPATGAAVRTSDPANDDFDSDNFSTTDRNGIASDGAGTPGYAGYLGTPSGTFRRYDAATGADTVL